jgi:hypothetical protein
MKPDKDQIVGRLASAALSCTGNFQLEGDAYFTHVNGTSLPFRDFACPFGFDGSCDSGVILIESRGDISPFQEGSLWSPPAGVLLVCVEVLVPHAVLAPPIFIPKLKA